MIEKQQIVKLLSKQDFIADLTINEIEQLIQKYPYFNLAYIIYARKIKSENLSYSQNLLNKISLNIPDRKELFNIITNDNYDKGIEIDENLLLNKEKVEQIVEERVETVVQMPVTPLVDSTVEPYFEETEEVVQFEQKSEERASEVEEEEKVENIEKSEVKELYPEPRNLKPKVEGLVEREILHKPISTNREIESFEDEIEDNVIDRFIKREEVEKERLSAFKQFEYAQSPVKEKQRPIEHEIELSSKGKSDKQMLESFLSENKATSIHNSRFEKPDPFESFDPEGSFLTETLAGIYIKQKKYLRAISIFKGLIKKYPEKKVYFANKIKEIEKLM